MSLLSILHIIPEKASYVKGMDDEICATDRVFLHFYTSTVEGIYLATTFSSPSTRFNRDRTKGVARMRRFVAIYFAVLSS